MSPSEQPTAVTSSTRPSRTSGVQQPTADKTKKPAPQKSSSQRLSIPSAASNQETIPSSDVLEAAKERLVEMTDTDDDTIDDIPEDNQDAAMTSSIDDDMEIVVDDVVTDDTPTVSHDTPTVTDDTPTVTHETPTVTYDTPTDENSTELKISRSSNRKSGTPVIKTEQPTKVDFDSSSRQRSTSRSKPQATLTKEEEKEASESQSTHRSSRRRSNIKGAYWISSNSSLSLIFSIAPPLVIALPTLR